VIGPQFLPGVPADHVIARLRQAGGNEIESGKLSSPESSSSLAVNCFGWFAERLDQFPGLPGLESAGVPELVEVEYCARFPWSGGRHPWLDAIVQTPTTLTGIESKRFEPFRDAKSVSLSEAYDRPVWCSNMSGYELMRDQLRSGAAKFTHLDAAQLVKHAFGLITDGRRRGRAPALFYLFAEPAARNGRPIPETAFALHRAEIEKFAEAVEGDEVTFHSASYREWLATWVQRGDAVSAHADAILNEFKP
jgi:hypothetical protein